MCLFGCESWFRQQLCLKLCRWVKQEGELAKQASESPAPKLDLSFKEGQTIKINISVRV